VGPVLVKGAVMTRLGAILLIVGLVIMGAPAVAAEHPPPQRRSRSTLGGKGR
jgi:hypothetical protein